MKIHVVWTGLVEVEAETFEDALKNVVLDREFMEVNTRISTACNGTVWVPQNNTLDHLKMHYAKEVLKG